MKDIKNKVVGSKITKDSEGKREKEKQWWRLRERSTVHWERFRRLQVYSYTAPDMTINTLKTTSLMIFIKKIDNNKNIEMKKYIILIMNQCKSISYRQDHEVWDHEAWLRVWSFKSLHVCLCCCICVCLIYVWMCMCVQYMCGIYVWGGAGGREGSPCITLNITLRLGTLLYTSFTETIKSLLNINVKCTVQVHFSLPPHCDLSFIMYLVIAG